MTKIIALYYTWWILANSVIEALTNLIFLPLTPMRQILLVIRGNEGKTYISLVYSRLLGIAYTMTSHATTTNKLGHEYYCIFNSKAVHCKTSPLPCITHPLIHFLSRYQDLWPNKPFVRYPNHHSLCGHREAYKNHSYIYTSQIFSLIDNYAYLFKTTYFYLWLLTW